MSALFPECSIAAQTWKIHELLADLDRVRQRLDPHSRGLEPWEQQYLCLLLSRQKPRQIAETLGYTIESLRVRLSKQRSLYECIQKLTYYEIENWRDVIIALMEKYHLGCSTPRSRIVILTVALNELTDQEINQLEQRLSTITGSDRIRIIGIDEGSMIFVIQADESASQRLAELWQSSQLSTALNLPVTAMDLTNVVSPLPVARPSAALNHLSQWWQGVFAAGWQPPSTLIALPAFKSIQDPASVVMAQEIDLDRDQPIALLVQASATPTEDIHVRVRLYPTSQSPYLHLPHGVELSVLDDHDMVCLQAQAGNTDVWINLEFNGKPSEYFTIKVRMGEDCMIENFII